MALRKGRLWLAVPDLKVDLIGIQCPLCAYDLSDRKLPTICSECGLSLPLDFWALRLPWENRSISFFTRLWQTASLVLFSPRITFTRSFSRTNVPISRQFILNSIWGLNLVVITYLSAILRTYVLTVIYCAEWFCLDEVLYRGWPNRYVIKEYFCQCVLLWVTGWLTVSIICFLVLSWRQPSRLSLGSVLAVFGPLPITSSIVTCTIQVASELAGDWVAPVFPFLEWIGYAFLYLFWIHHILLFLSVGSTPVKLSSVSRPS